MFVQSSISQGGEISLKSEEIKKLIQNEIEEVQQIYKITKVESDLRNTLQQQEYLCRLCEYIDIQILFNYDYPQSNPKYFVQAKFKKNPLINEDTWQIKIQNENKIIDTLNKILIQFKLYPPQPDDWIVQQIQDSQQDLSVQLQPNFNQQELKILEKLIQREHNGKQISEIILSIQRYIDLQKLMKAKAIKNQTIKEIVEQNDAEIMKLKNDLDSIYFKFQQAQLDVEVLNAQCQQIQNKFSNQELLGLLQEKIDKLDSEREKLYEQSEIYGLGEKEQLYRKFLDDRIEYYICNSTQLILTQNIKQQNSYID